MTAEQNKPHDSVAAVNYTTHISLRIRHAKNSIERTQ